MSLFSVSSDEDYGTQWQRGSGHGTRRGCV